MGQSRKLVLIMAQYAYNVKFEYDEQNGKYKRYSDGEQTVDARNIKACCG